MNTEPIYIIKFDGTKEQFDVAKLEHSLRHAGANSKIIESILSTITDTLTDGMTTRDIYNKAFELLHSDDRPVAIRYSLKRAIMELGPSGFPFEDYVAEILKTKGFETLTGQIVKGQYVEHEIDVVAWNPEKLIMVEAKFHNQLGVKSDLKIALYVKERFDDLSTQTFDYGKKGRQLDEGWLVTNTKFTSTAIEYGSHQGNRLVMIGWNYPTHGNLHDMILETKLHPLTCLTTLDGHAKKELLNAGIVLCKTILENPDILETVGVRGEEAQKVREEIELL
ncbi:MAG: ATP cone domain-containing protein [bacterium]